MNYTIRPERKEDYREVENHVETVVFLSIINPRPCTHIEIGVDAEDYYKLKSKEKSHIPVDVDMDEYRGIEDGIQNNTL